MQRAFCSSGCWREEGKDAQARTQASCPSFPGGSRAGLHRPGLVPSSLRQMALWGLHSEEERAWAPLPGRAPPGGQPTSLQLVFHRDSPQIRLPVLTVTSYLETRAPGTRTHVAHGGQLLTQGPTFQCRGGSLLGVDSIVINGELSAHEVGSAGQARSVQGHPPSAQGSKQLTVCPVRSLQSILG